MSKALQTFDALGGDSVQVVAGPEADTIATEDLR
jgi:hypothetical protein